MECVANIKKGGMCHLGSQLKYLYRENKGSLSSIQRLDRVIMPSGEISRMGQLMNKIQAFSGWLGRGDALAWSS